MPSIRILPEHLSNKIAAGEVVERPASVVKELVENAIDAKSSTITVEIENGGRSLIRVSDDGTGMDPDDALLCLERHATSKIADESGLFSIRTLGFRGEAIPSIASVSEFVITTRTKDSDNGTTIVVSGGTIKDVRETGAPIGTTVEVRRLFFNTPARRKFMKSVSTETAHIADTMTAFALCRSDIHFKLIHNGKTVKNWPRTKNPLERAADILGQNTKGGLIPVAHEEGMVSISGWISSPAISRTTSRKIYLFVNGRVIKDRGLQYALFEGYRGRLVKGLFPVAAVFIKIPFDRIDVNVHPAKTEVRFADQRRVYQCMKTAVASALAAAQTPPWEKDSPSRSGTIQAPGPLRSPSIVSEPVSRYMQSIETLLPGTEAPAPAQETGNISPALSPGQTDTVPKHGFTGLQVIGQLFNTYIVCQAENRLVLVDQHAAHERILFEALKQARENRGASQGLLVPETIDLTHSAAAALEPMLEDLGALGLEIEPFGKNAFVVKAVPPLLSDADVSAMVQEIAEKLADTGFSPGIDTIMDDVLHVMACHGAIRAHQRLSEREMEELLARLDLCENPMHCPHGRPTSISWSTQEIEKLFKRIV